MRTMSLAAAVALMAVAAGCAGGRGMGMGGGPSTVGSLDLDGWAPASRTAAMEMEAKYGPPDEVTPTMLVWHDNGPWKRTVISRTETPHSFPMPHPDVMEQVIDYRVPPEMFDELAMYDGSVIAERTRGELSARCDKEGANFLALNLAHEIATGKRTVADARRMYAEQIMAMKAGRPAPYTERLLFQPMPGASMDPDRPAPTM
ncbi:MAG TPA: hypothetical protein VHG91_14435 [Longimicrobium sp.]|nr:hypothetical protein [Longimicrobium sp.]